MSRVSRGTAPAHRVRPADMSAHEANSFLREIYAQLTPETAARIRARHEQVRRILTSGTSTNISDDVFNDYPRPVPVPTALPARSVRIADTSPPPRAGPSCVPRTPSPPQFTAAQKAKGRVPPARQERSTSVTSTQNDEPRNAQVAADLGHDTSRSYP